MPRRISDDFPPCPARPANAKAYPGDSYETLELDIQVVTPMFGGGSEAGVPDPVTLIRPSSIRGHLRFWWRATRGADFTTVRDLKQRETEIFGDTEHPSPVIVEVRLKSEGETKPCAFLPPGRSFPRFADNHPGYVLFPFQGNAGKGIPIGSGTIGATFDLRVVCPSNLRDEVNAAVWGWINFGGLGARTRRGCGSLMCRNFSPASCQPEAIREWMLIGKKYLAGETPAGLFSTAFRCLLVASREQTPMAAWNSAVGTFRDFRQGSDIGRNGNQGRSLWPEPETIRRLTGQRLPKHQSQDTVIPNDGFPRAEFGLPIVFHFKDGARDQRSQQQDPRETELYPVVNGERSGRMASPLVIKALAAADGSAMQLVAALRAPDVEKVELISERKSIPGSSDCQIRDARFETYERSPLKGRSLRGSAIDAFIAFATKDRSFKRLEVQP